MAVVPYNEGVPTVEPDRRAPDDYQHIQVDPNAFGANIAQATQQLGQAGIHVARFFGEAAADNAQNDFEDFATKKLHGDPNLKVQGPSGEMVQDTGYLGLKGRAALDARPALMQELEARRNFLRDQLTTPESQLKFDNASRRYHNYTVNQVGTHADNQANTWYGEVNTAQGNNALRHISNNWSNDAEVAHGVGDLVSARVKQAQLQGGGNDLIEAAVNGAKRDALKARLEAMAVHDPARAMRDLEKSKDTAGLYYHTLAQEFKARADAKDGQALGGKAILQANTDRRVIPANAAAPESGTAPGGAALTPARVHDAIVGQESGGNPNAPTSTDGAMGIGQIMPATFRQYARPGEVITNPVDNYAVSRRIIDDYYQRYDGDAARVAVAYFSGPGNVAPAGSATPYLRNAADGNGKLTADYVNDVLHRVATGPNAAQPASLKGGAYQVVMNDPGASQEVKQQALHYINQTYTAAQIASDSDARARKQLVDQTGDKYVQRIMQGDTKNIINEISADPNLDVTMRTHLWNIAEKHVGTDLKEATASYGPGFWDAYKKVTAPPGDPDRIGDPGELYRRAGTEGPNSLTLAGATKLHQTMQVMQKSVNDHAVAQTQASLMAYAKSKLSFEADTGPIKIRDPKGEAIFNAQFVPQFLQGYDAWTKSGKDPYEYLTKERIDKMATQMRSKQAMEQDRLKATGEGAAESAETQRGAIPLAPAEVDERGWASVMRAPPNSQSGKPWPYANWAAVVNNLRTDPTEERIKQFDAMFGVAGYSGQEIIGKLKKAERKSEGVGTGRDFVVPQALGYGPWP